MNNLKSNNHSLVNSGRVTPLNLQRNFDSKRYMRVNDLDLKKKPGKVIVPQTVPEGLENDADLIRYKQIPKQK